MKAKLTESGQIAVSLKGHDAGRWYAVVGVLDERYVLLCDGNTRTLAKPKKKQIKHLRALPLSMPVTGRGESGGPIANSDIRKGILAAQKAYETKTGFAHAAARQEKEKEECAFVQK